MTTRCDVLVVGLGPAGSRAAWAAARRGLSVVAVERKPRGGAPVQCAEFVPLQLDRELGPLDALTRQRVAAMTSTVGNGARLCSAGFAGRMIDRARFDAALAERAADAGADCRFATALRRIAADGTVELAGGERIWPRLIVGADGPRSTVGRAAGLRNAALVETRQYRVTLREALDSTDIFLSPAYVGGYGWLFPRAEGANLGIGVVPAARARLKPLLDGLHRRLAGKGRVGAEIHATTGGAIPVGGIVGPAGLLGVVPVLLAGDAAGLAHPITGGGIAPAVLSGALAGEAAAGWLGGRSDAIHAYAEEIEALFGRAYAHALERRRALLANSRPGRADLRRAWIGYPEYRASVEAQG